MRNANYQGPFGNTLLHGAVLCGDGEEVRRLLAAGADPSIANREGRTAIHVAVILGRRELCELLAPERDCEKTDGVSEFRHERPPLRVRKVLTQGPFRDE